MLAGRSLSVAVAVKVNVLTFINCLVSNCVDGWCAVDFINSDSDRLSICQTARAIICDNDVEGIAAEILELRVGVQLNSPVVALMVAPAGAPLKL